MIYLSEPLMAEAKLIPNFSEVVQTLFRDYLQTKKSKEALLAEADLLKSEKLKLIQEADREINKINLEVKKVETEEEKSKAAEDRAGHKLANKISACVENTKEVFNIDITPEQAEEFLKSNYRTIIEFLEFNK